jgi:hypothetical protein
MKLKALALLSGLLSALLGASELAASPTNHYETVICDNCNYERALAIANEAKYTPKLKCFSGKSGGPEDQQCWSTTTKLVVYDMATQQAHGFFIGHQSQGLAHHDMTLSVRDMPQPPAELVKGLQDMVSVHQTMSEISRDLQQNTDFTALLNAAHLALPEQQLMSSADTECADSPEMLVMRAARNPRIKTAIQLMAQRKYDTSLSYRLSFTGLNLDSFGFNADLNGTTLGIGFSGTFKFIEQGQQVIGDYELNAKFPRLDHYNQVVYKLSVKNNGVFVETDFEKTILSNVRLVDIIQSGSSSNDNVKAEMLSKCAAEAIDQEFPKIITPAGDVVPDYSNGNNSGALVRPGFGKMPLSRRGGGGGSYQTCDHHYYDRQGNHLFSIGGPCP